MNKKEQHPRTVSINQKQKIQCRQARQKALKWLTERFPKAFDTSEQIFPLSVGIIHEILSYSAEASELGISRAKLRQAVVVFTRRIDYLASLKSQGIRVNLQGEACGVVTEKEALSAAQKIKNRIEKTIKNQSKSYLESSSKFSQSDYFPGREPVKKTEILFKSKSTRAIDPRAVERLKSKLGLHKKEEIME
jgi:ProP effector